MFFRYCFLYVISFLQCVFLALLCHYLSYVFCLDPILSVKIRQYNGIIKVNISWTHILCDVFSLLIRLLLCNIFYIFLCSLNLPIIVSVLASIDVNKRSENKPIRDLTEEMLNKSLLCPYWKYIQRSHCTYSYHV